MNEKIVITGAGVAILCFSITMTVETDWLQVLGLTGTLLGGLTLGAGLLWKTPQKAPIVAAPAEPSTERMNRRERRALQFRGKKA